MKTKVLYVETCCSNARTWWVTNEDKTGNFLYVNYVLKSFALAIQIVFIIKMIKVSKNICSCFIRTHFCLKWLHIVQKKNNTNKNILPRATKFWMAWLPSHWPYYYYLVMSLSVPGSVSEGGQSEATVFRFQITKKWKNNTNCFGSSHERLWTWLKWIVPPLFSFVSNISLRQRERNNYL